MLKKLVSGILVVFMLLSCFPAGAISFERDWIVEFGSAEAAQSYLNTHPGRMLCDTMVLTRGTREEFEGRSDVLSLTQDSKVKGAAVSVNDPRKSDQYYLSDQAIYVTQAWNYLNETLSGKGLTEAESAPICVAVIDTGVDATHEDLINRVSSGYDAVNDTEIPIGTDSDISGESHGTMVAGLIAAEANNGVGIAGTAYTLPVNILPVRALDSDATGKLSDIIAALYWAVDQGGADIINMSFGMRRSTRPAALESAVRHAIEHGVILIAAAGNEGRYVSYDDYHYYPAAIDGVLAVGSLTRSTYSYYYGTVPDYSYFSNKMQNYNGEGPVGKSFFYTSGEDLLTTAKGGNYQTFTGTSASAAVFSGMVASLLSVSRATDGIDPRVAITNSSVRYGSVLFQRFDTAALNLKNGYSVDAWWSSDSYQPYILRATTEIMGYLSDPSFKISSVRAVLEDEDGNETELTSVPRSFDIVQQPVSFLLDTTAMSDGEYTLQIIGTPSSPDEGETVLYQNYYIIDNNGSNYLLTAFEDDQPMVGANVDIYNSAGNWAQEGRTDSLGNFAVSAAEADKGGMTALVEGEENIYVWSLETHPRDNVYTLHSEPSTLTATAGAQTLASLSGASLNLILPNGGVREMAKITGENTGVSLCTNMPLTFTVSSNNITLTGEFSLAEGDKTWNLDEALAQATTLTVQSSYADATGLYLSAGDKSAWLPAEGGSIILPRGQYDVTVKVYKQDDPEDSSAAGFTVDFGNVDLSSDRTLSIGSSVEAQFAIADDSIVQNENIDATLTFRDNLGNTVSDVLYVANIDDPEYTTFHSSIQNYRLHIERMQDDDTWEDLESQYVEWKKINGGFTTAVSTSEFDNIVGDYRIGVECEDIWPVDMSDCSRHTFTVTAEESRPSARVNFSFNNEYGYFDSDSGFYVLLKDENDRWISRKAMMPSQTWSMPQYTFLPVGQTYSCAMLASCYNNTLEGYAAVAAKFTVDLTDKAPGDTVDVTIQPDENWIITSFDTGEDEEESDSVYFYINEVTVYPFDILPDAAVKKRDVSGNLYGILTRDIGEMKIDVSMTADEDSYNTVAVSTLTHDFAENGSVAVSLPLDPKLTCAQANYFSGSDVVLGYQLFDKAGNAVKDVSYTIFSKDDEEIPGGTHNKPAEAELAASVTVKHANGSAVGTYDLDSIYSGSVTIAGLADGSYTAAATVNCPILGRTGNTVSFTVGGDAPSELDRTVPPADFTARAQSMTEIKLAWSAPDETPAKYLLYRDGVLFTELSGNAVTYTDEGITSDRYYTYTLYAMDVYGNRSEGVNVGSRPAAQPDNTPPTVPTGLNARISGSQVMLSWNRSTDNVAVTCYIITCNGEEVGRGYNRSFAHAGLVPGSSCTYTVSAVDGAGNRSSESETVSVTVPDSSGISYANISYSRNKAGLILGEQITTTLRATADITTVEFTANYTLEDGTSDSSTVTLDSGKNGTFTGKITLPQEFRHLDTATVKAYRSGESEPVDTEELLTAPVIRGGEMTVSLTNRQNLTLPECAGKAGVTLSGIGGAYSVTRTVENFSGSFRCFPPESDDYILTVTGEDGSILMTVNDIAINGEDGSLSFDASEMNKFISLTLTGLPQGISYEGIDLSVSVGANMRATGTADRDGHIFWSDGGRLLSVNEADCFSFQDSPYVTVNVNYKDIVTEDIIYRVGQFKFYKYLTEPVNNETAELKLDFNSIKTITAHVKDKNGRPARGVTVDFAGASSVQAVTDENGIATARVPVYTYHTSQNSNYTYSKAMVSVKPQTSTEGIIWSGASNYNTLDSCEITLTPKSDQFRFDPDITFFCLENDGEREMTAAESSPIMTNMTATLTKLKDNGMHLVSYVYETYDMLYLNGMWSAPGLTMRDGEEYKVTLKSEIGTRKWSAVYQGRFDIDNPVCTVPIEMYENGRHRITVTSADQGALPGVSRRIIVYNESGEKISDTVTFSAFTYVELPYGENVSIVTTFDTVSDNTLAQWKKYGRWAQCRMIHVADNVTPYQFNPSYGANFDSLFWRENGYSCEPSQVRQPDGEWKINFRYTAWGTIGLRSKFDYIVLPEGAHDVDFSFNARHCSYDGETGTITIDQSKIGFNNYDICLFSFKISPDDLEKDPEIISWFEAELLSGVEYNSPPRTMYLKPSGVELMGLETVYREDLLERAQQDGSIRKGGYNLTVNSQLYGTNTTVSIYDNDTLLVNQILRASTTKYDLPIGMDYGTRTLTVVVTKGDIQDIQTKKVKIVHDDTPAIVSLNIGINDGGGTVVGKNADQFKRTYRHKDTDSVSVTVQMRRPELVEKVYAVVVCSNRSKITMGLKNLGDGQYWGSSLFSCPDNPVSSVEVFYIPKKETGDSVKLAVDFDASLGEEGGTYYDIAYCAAPTDEQIEQYLINPEGNPEQAQALSDWDKYVDLIYHAEHMDSEEFFEQLDQVYGDDGEWTLPMAHGDSGVDYSFTFIKDSERAKQFLASDKAFTMLIGEDKVKMGYEIEYDPNGRDILLHIYGDIDYFYPRVPEPDTVSGDWFWEDDYGGHQNVKHTVVKDKRPEAEIPGAGETIVKGINAAMLLNDYSEDPDYSDYDDIINDPCATVSQKEAAKQKKLLAMGQHVGDMAIDTISQIGPDETNAGTWGHIALGGGLGYLGNRWDQLNSILDNDPSRTADPCDRDPEDPDDDDDDDDRKVPSGTGHFLPLVDPSGVIFEAAEDNTLGGVSASVYYKDTDTDEWVLWDSEAYGQNLNPMQSYEDGWYGWDVLEGKWKVVYEKNGYFVAESEELDVPPEHTDVNISLVSSTAPQVDSFTAKADGSSVTLTFDKYMLTEDILRDGAVTVTLGDIIPDGELTAVDPKTTSAGNKQADSINSIVGGSQVAKQFVYTFADPLPKGAMVNISVSDEVSAYNRMTLTQEYNSSAVVPDSDPAVYADSMAFEDSSLLEKEVGDTFTAGSLTFVGELPGTLRYESSDESVLTVDENGNVTAVGAGYATVWVYCDTLETGRPVNVTRNASVPDESENAVVFCRKDNLVVNKGCWMWSDAANFDLEDPIEGDGKYLAVSWRILENGTQVAGETLEEGLYAVKSHINCTIITGANGIRSMAKPTPQAKR